MDDREIVYEYESGEGGDPVRTIAAGDPGYPGILRAALGADAPERLRCTGAAALLREPCVMVCGARDASETALGLARRCGRMIAGAGIVLASGYARGVDMAAHRGALDGGGSTIAVLPYGLMRFRVHRELRDVFAPERFLAVSESRSWQVFSPRAALRRNTVLAALARAVIVVEPGESGGTWYSAERAHRMGRPLFYLEGDRPQVAARMESLGGVRIPVRRGDPDLAGVLAAV